MYLDNGEYFNNTHSIRINKTVQSRIQKEKHEEKAKTREPHAAALRAFPGVFRARRENFRNFPARRRPANTPYLRHCPFAVGKTQFSGLGGGFSADMREPRWFTPLCNGRAATDASHIQHSHVCTCVTWLASVCVCVCVSSAVQARCWSGLVFGDEDRALRVGLSLRGSLQLALGSYGVFKVKVFPPVTMQSCDNASVFW